MIKDKRILLLGDLAIDRYHWGRCRDFNPEAPVPILDLVNTEDRPGMAGNVAANLGSFDCTVDTIYGDIPSVKNRYMDLRTHRCLLRVDQDGANTSIKVPEDLSIYDAIIISDYNKGSISLDTVRTVVDRANCRVFMDTKIRDLAQLEGVTLKINRREWNNRISDHSDVVVTLGEDGVRYQDLEFQPDPIEVHDVCGAGDTYLAALVAAWVRWQNMTLAVGFALRASGIAVSHMGTYALSKEDVERLCESL